MIRTLTRPLMLAVLILASAIITLAADPAPTNQCIRVEVGIEGFHDQLTVETPLELHRGTGHGGGTSFSHGEAHENWSMGIGVSGIERNRVVFNISLRFIAVDSLGKTITEGVLKEELNIVPRKVTLSAFDPGVTIKSYLARCQQAPVVSK